MADMVRTSSWGGRARSDKDGKAGGGQQRKRRGAWSTSTGLEKTMLIIVPVATHLALKVSEPKVGSSCACCARERRAHDQRRWPGVQAD